MLQRKTFFYTYLDSTNLEENRTEHKSITEAFETAKNNGIGGVLVISMNKSGNRSDWKETFPISEFNDWQAREFESFVLDQTPEQDFY